MVSKKRQKYLLAFPLHLLAPTERRACNSNLHSARDELGARRFQPKEVLTGQQIIGFFLQLAAKKKLAPSTVNRGDSDDEVPGEDNRAAEAEAVHSEISVHVMREVSLQHPIASTSGYKSTTISLSSCKHVRRNRHR